MRLHPTSEIDRTSNFDLERSFFGFAFGRTLTLALGEYKLDLWQVKALAAMVIPAVTPGRLIQTQRRANGDNAD